MNRSSSSSRIRVIITVIMSKWLQETTRSTPLRSRTRPHGTSSRPLFKTRTQSDWGLCWTSLCSISFFRCSYKICSIHSLVCPQWRNDVRVCSCFSTIMELIMQKRVWSGLWEFLRSLPVALIFFVFHLCTKAYFFMQGFIVGKGSYIATDRGFDSPSETSPRRMLRHISILRWPCCLPPFVTQSFWGIRSGHSSLELWPSSWLWFAWFNYITIGSPWRCFVWALLLSLSLKTPDEAGLYCRYSLDQCCTTAADSCTNGRTRISMIIYSCCIWQEKSMAGIRKNN